MKSMYIYFLITSVYTQNNPLQNMVAYAKYLNHVALVHDNSTLNVVPNGNTDYLNFAHCGILVVVIFNHLANLDDYKIVLSGQNSLRRWQ